MESIINRATFTHCTQADFMIVEHRFATTAVSPGLPGRLRLDTPLRHATPVPPLATLHASAIRDSRLRPSQRGRGHVRNERLPGLVNGRPQVHHIMLQLKNSLRRVSNQRHHLGIGDCHRMMSRRSAHGLRQPCTASPRRHCEELLERHRPPRGPQHGHWRSHGSIRTEALEVPAGHLRRRTAHFARMGAGGRAQASG